MAAPLPTKAFLLAAGLGTRLRPLTDATPKCLVPVGGRPLLHWWLRICERLGVQDVLLNTHHLAPQVRDFVRTRTSSVRVTLYHEEKLLGSAGTLAVNKHFVSGEKSFWIFYADTLVGADLSPMAELHASRKADLTLGVFDSPDPKSGGVVELGPEGKVLSFEEKPAQPKSSLVAAGVYVAGPRLLGALPKLSGDLSLDVFPKLMDNAYAQRVGPVMDLGTPQRYAQAQKEFPSFGLR